MIDDFEISFEVGVVDLLKEDIEFAFDFFSFIEEVKLVLLFLGEDPVDKLLKLFGAGLDWEFVDSKGIIPVVDEIDDDVFGDLDDGL